MSISNYRNAACVAMSFLPVVFAQPVGAAADRAEFWARPVSPADNGEFRPGQKFDWAPVQGYNAFVFSYGKGYRVFEKLFVNKTEFNPSVEEYWQMWEVGSRYQWRVQVCNGLDRSQQRLLFGQCKNVGNNNRERARTVKLAPPPAPRGLRINAPGAPLSIGDRFTWPVPPSWIDKVKITIAPRDLKGEDPSAAVAVTKGPRDSHALTAAQWWAFWHRDRMYAHIAACKGSACSTWSAASPFTFKKLEPPTLSAPGNGSKRSRSSLGLQVSHAKFGQAGGPSLIQMCFHTDANQRGCKFKGYVDHPAPHQSQFERVIGSKVLDKMIGKTLYWKASACTSGVAPSEIKCTEWTNWRAVRVTR